MPDPGAIVRSAAVASPTRFARSRDCAISGEPSAGGSGLSAATMASAKAEATSALTGVSRAAAIASAGAPARPLLKCSPIYQRRLAANNASASAARSAGSSSAAGSQID